MATSADLQEEVAVGWLGGRLMSIGETIFRSVSSSAREVSFVNIGTFACLRVFYLTVYLRQLPQIDNSNTANMYV